MKPADPKLVLRIVLILLFIVSCNWLYVSRGERIYKQFIMKSPVDDLISKTTDIKYKNHLKRLRYTLPSNNFNVVISKPFVVIGDIDSLSLQMITLKVIRNSVIALKKAYFKNDPDEIIDIWLFKDKNSYETNVRKLCGFTPETPYGFYLDEANALLMNISTGGGTLIHEICHPFTDANFPECPPWLFEGLGSLYEQTTYKDDEIMGMVNWRLENLQYLIETKALPSFENLFAMNREEFYEKDIADNYAQSRYLCYYLQEKKLLRKFYHEFHSNHEKDPTGLKSLKKIAEIKSMKDFTSEWEDFVIKLQN